MASQLASVLAGGSPLRPQPYQPYQHSPGLRQSGAHVPHTASGTTQRPATPQAQHQQPPVQPQAPPGVYDLNTDPLLQQIQAMTGKSDTDAAASALRQREQLLTGYGDPSLAAAVLGAGDPFVQAAAQNPTSVLAQLRQQHDRQLHDLIESLNQNNLFYSGNRILREQQDANDYQAGLANAAANVQGGLDTISSSLASALAANEQNRAQALQDAYGRALQTPHPVAAPGGYSPQPSDYTSSAQPGTIYTLPGGQHVAIQPSGYVAPAYVGPTGDFVSPLTGAGAEGGYSPLPVTGVAPPDTSAFTRTTPQSELQRIADLLYRRARGGPIAV